MDPIGSIACRTPDLLDPIGSEDEKGSTSRISNRDSREFVRGVRRIIRRETNFRADFEAWRSGGAPPSDSLEVETNPVSPPIDIFSKSSRSSSRFSSRGRGWRSLLGRRLPGLYPLRYMDRLAGRRPTKMAPSEKRSCFRRGSPSAWVHAGCGSSAPLHVPLRAFFILPSLYGILRGIISVRYCLASRG